MTSNYAFFYLSFPLYVLNLLKALLSASWNYETNWEQRMCQKCEQKKNKCKKQT